MTEPSMGPGMAVNMSACEPWIREGVKRFEVVENSWFIYRQNGLELIVFLNYPSKHPAEFLKVAMADPNESWAFWGSFNQRLHNFLASVVSLVDHARRLTGYYEEDAPRFVSEFNSSNQKIAARPESQFLRELRNYMLHCSQPPLTTHVSLGETVVPRIAFNARQLLDQDDRSWKPTVAHYLESFGDSKGLDILELVEGYTREMDSLFSWLFKQRNTLTSLYPERFWIEWPGDT